MQINYQSINQWINKLIASAQFDFSHLNFCFLPLITLVTEPTGIVCPVFPFSSFELLLNR